MCPPPGRLRKPDYRPFGRWREPAASACCAALFDGSQLVCCTRNLGRAATDVSVYTEEVVRIVGENVVLNSDAAVVASEGVVAVIERVVANLMATTTNQETAKCLSALVTRDREMLEMARSTSDALNNL